MARNRSAMSDGVYVLVVTALLAIIVFVQPGAGTSQYIAGGAVVVLLLLGAWLLARFVRKHGDEIGEARFDTRNKGEREG